MHARFEDVFMNDFMGAVKGCLRLRVMGKCTSRVPFSYEGLDKKGVCTEMWIVYHMALLLRLIRFSSVVPVKVITTPNSFDFVLGALSIALCFTTCHSA